MSPLMSILPVRHRYFARLHRLRAIGFAGALIAILQPISPQAVRADDDSAASRQTTKNPLAAQSIQSLSATLKRPLFAPSRRPPPPEPEAVVHAAPPPPPNPPPATPSVRLIGTVIDALGSQAILRSASDNKDMRVRVGDNVSGWKVKDIEKSRLVLVQDQRTFFVVLFSQTPTSPKPTVKPNKGRQT
jgi:hypothetical protein